MAILISEHVLAKLKDKHGVTAKEVDECFLNHCGKFIVDTSEEHQSDPPTHWFLAYTNKLRMLKIAFILKGKDFHIRTAYEPSQRVVALWRDQGGPVLTGNEDDEC